MKRGLLRFFRKTPILFFLLLIGNHDLSAQNILTNGDFESGGSAVGFLVHDYVLINPLTGTSTPGRYARTTNPALMNSTYIAGGDHTTGSGNMLVFDGATVANRFFWTTGNTGGAIGGFTAGTTYTFSFWIKSVSNEVTSDNTTRANIGAFFVNANSVNPANLSNLAPLPSEGWVRIAYSFVATANNVMVRLKTNTPGPVGHDFAVDDFSIIEGGLPFVGSYTSVNPTCPTGTDGSITVNLTGGTLPYTSYVLTGSASQTNNNGIFNGLGEGTYTVTVSDSSGQQYTQTGIVLAAPNNLQLSAPVTICSGESTSLSATGGIGTYNWTANPADASLTNPNSATQTVSPTVTTTYTVTSGTPSSPVNLIPNGDFSQGNVSFITGYAQVDDPNPFGVQSSYDIVTNPNAWFTPFASCGDHTTGSGNLMVFDGSTDPTGSTVAWATEIPVTVLPNTNYTFSYYVASVSPDNPARLEATINGFSQGTPVLAPSTACLWTLVSYNWNSGVNTSASIAIFDRNFANFGNDFALDDISLKETATCLYEKTVTVTVTPTTTPTFSTVNPICSGATLNALPTTSNNSITGTWSPALNNTSTTTYTFMPTAGQQCVSPTTLSITVNQPVAAAFTAVNPICSGATLEALPTTSTNGFNGTWSPALDNTTTTTYTFTPVAGQCALSSNLTVVVTPSPVFTLSSGCNGVSFTLSAVVESTATSTAYAWTNPENAPIGSESTVVISTPGTYELAVTQNGCTTEESINVLSPTCGIQKGISANNDGLNDNFDLEGYNVKQLKIFNRYGVAVYAKSNYENEWYGQSDGGDDLPDGTYYYVIDFEDLKTKAGWIYINRVQ
jgi:gliding motility-associated-like protein